MRSFAFNISSNLVRKLSSFTYLNITQFLGALNDNIYKLLLVYFFIELDGIGSKTAIKSWPPRVPFLFSPLFFFLHPQEH